MRKRKRTDGEQLGDLDEASSFISAGLYGKKKKG